MLKHQFLSKKNEKIITLNDEMKYSKNNINISPISKIISNKKKSIELLNNLKLNENNYQSNFFNQNNELFGINNYQSIKTYHLNQTKIENLQNTFSPPKNIYKSVAEIELKYELIIIEKDKIINKLKEEIEYYKNLLERSNDIIKQNQNSKNKILKDDIINTPQKNKFSSFIIFKNKSKEINDNETLFENNSIKNETINSERLNNYNSAKPKDMLLNFFSNSNFKNRTLHKKNPSNSISSTYNESYSGVSNNQIFNSPTFRNENKSNLKKIFLNIQPNELFKENINTNDYKNNLNQITLKITKLIDKLFKYVK